MTLNTYLKATIYGTVLAAIWWGISRDLFVPMATFLSVPIFYGSPKVSDRDRLIGAVLTSFMFAVALLFMERHRG